MKFYRECLKLYAVTDRRFKNNKSLYEQVKEALNGGVTCVQLREKSLDTKAFLNEVKEILPLCNEYNVPLIINDNVEVALLCGGAGVHLGQNDTDTKEARRMLGKDKIIGISVQNAEQAIEAERDGADYLGVGAVFNTNTKDDAESVSIDTLKEICDSVKIPVVAIGGICAENAYKLKDSGIAGIAVVSAVFGAEDVERASRELKMISEKVVE